LIVRGDFDTFVQAVADYLNSPDFQKRLADNALKTRDRLTLEFMVNAFDEAVTKVIRARNGEVFLERIKTKS
jgi:hypothetical protein